MGRVDGETETVNPRFRNKINLLTAHNQKPEIPGNLSDNLQQLTNWSSFILTTLTFKYCNTKRSMHAAMSSKIFLMSDLQET